MILTDNEFTFLISELEKTPILKNDELNHAKVVHPQIYYTTINSKHIDLYFSTEKSCIFSLNNKNLNKFLCDKFNESEERLYMMHRLIYGVGGFAKRHKDRLTTYKTVSVLLSDDFEGGEMLINDELVSLNLKGEYVVFNGGNEFHEVKPIKKGYRDVLIVWFSKKEKPNHSLI